MPDSQGITKITLAIGQLWEQISGYFGDGNVFNVNVDYIKEELWEQPGAYLDDSFVCPHHPDRGFPGERLEYKVDCDCRRPKPGMLLQVAEKYNIDLKESWMVGDQPQDVQVVLLCCWA